MSDPFFAAMHQVIDGAVGRIERMGQQCRATGNHLAAQNDEPEPLFTEAELIEIDRQVEHRKATDALRQERELRALHEQMNRRPA